LLVPRGDEANTRFVAQRGHYAVKLHTGQSEYDAHAFPVELLDDGLAAGHPSHDTMESKGF
jgi:hypothetical protein